MHWLRGNQPLGAVGRRCWRVEVVCPKIALKQNRFELWEEDLRDRDVTIRMQLSGVLTVKVWWPHRFVDPVVLCNCLHQTVELSGCMYVVFDITIITGRITTL